MRKNTKSFFFLVPLLVMYFGVFLIPILLTILSSLTKWAGIDTPVFIGFDNYVRMFRDPVFIVAWVNNVKWLIIFLTVPVGMAILGAFLLAPIKRFAMFYRSTFFLPYVLMSVVNAQIWKALMNPRSGIGTWLANMTGMNWLGVYWLARPGTTLYAVAFIDNWHFWGFLLVIYLTAMQAIDRELYEAADLDGTNRLQQLWYITLPGIRPTMITMWLMITIWSFGVFDYIYVLTNPLGGTGHSAEVLATYAYSTGFKNFEFGYATAIGTVLAMITLIISTIYINIQRKSEAS
jgi:raffinose/stachyose/melibiose transport system permease protein